MLLCIHQELKHKCIKKQSTLMEQLLDNFLHQCLSANIFSFPFFVLLVSRFYSIVLCVDNILLVMNLCMSFFDNPTLTSYTYTPVQLSLTLSKHRLTHTCMPTVTPPPFVFLLWSRAHACISNQPIHAKLTFSRVFFKKRLTN